MRGRRLPFDSSTLAAGGAIAALAALALGAQFARQRAAAPATAAAAGLGGLPAGVQPAGLNVVFITLDTTRADRIGAYGWAPSVTPNLDRLATEGTLFEQALAPAPLTLPAHASLFTGKYPPQHGVRDNGGFVLDEHETTIAERLQAAGARTGAVVGAYVLDRRWGIAQGFERYVDDFDVPKVDTAASSEVERRADEVVDLSLQWLATVKSARFFTWLHFYDAHSPYAPPAEYRARYASQPYLGELAFIDVQIGRVRAFLEQERLLDRTIIVVVGDHGESLGDHGESTHGFFIYQSVLRVPVVIRSPYDALRGRRVADLVRTVDIMPTLLDLVGLPHAEPADGRSLVPLMTGAARDIGLAAYAESVYPRFHYGWSGLRSLTSDRFKFIEAPRPELYDLVQDPNETRNLYDERRSLADRMAAALTATAASQRAEVTPPADVDAETRARLAALGYVGTFVATPTVDRQSLADPKDKIELFNLIGGAREQLNEDPDSDAGLNALRRVVASDPQVVDAWLMLGNEYSRRREYSRALDAFQRALALKPDYDLAVFNMANVYRTMGKDDEALVRYRRLLAIDPRNAQAHQAVAQVLVDQDRLDDAQASLNRALEIQPAMAAARNTLGALRLKQGDIDGGEREILAALAQHTRLRHAHFNLALAAEQRGDVNRAVAEYQKEIELFPGSYMAQFNLGKIYEKLGKRHEQQAAYRAAIDSNPDFAEGYLFLAKLVFDLGERTEAIELARRGLALAPAAAFAPLGHFVIADVYAAEGRRDAADRELAHGRQLAARPTRR